MERSEFFTKIKGELSNSCHGVTSSKKYMVCKKTHKLSTKVSNHGFSTYFVPSNSMYQKLLMVPNILNILETPAGRAPVVVSGNSEYLIVSGYKVLEVCRMKKKIEL